MPGALAAPIIGAVGSLGGALIGSRQAGKAQQSQERANAAALQYQREQDTMNRSDWAKAMEAYQANRNALLQRYGISVPQAPMAQAPGPGMPPGQEMRRGPMQGRPLRGIPGNLGAFARGGYTGGGNPY